MPRSKPRTAACARKVVYTRTALADLDAIPAYLAGRNPGAAARIEDDVRASIGRAAEFPFSGRAQDEAGVRKVVTPAYRYRVFYMIDAGEGSIIILSILAPGQLG